MSTHSTLSPSSRVRWSKCAASVRESLKYPPSPSGPAAIDGTHTHTLLEHCLKASAFTSSNMIGVKLKDHEGEFVIDKERTERVDVALKYINDRVQQQLIAKGIPPLVYAETRVDPHYFVGRHDMAGTVDVRLIMGRVLEIIDYKDGINPVSAEDNHQMEMYALGSLAEYRLPVTAEYPVDTVRMTIIQPKLALKGLPPISSVEVSVQDMLAKIPQIIAEAKATDDPNAPFNPGESQCKYCPAKGGCSALVTSTMETAGISFANLDVAKEAANKNPNEMTDQQVREIVEAIPLLRQMLEAVEEEAQRRLEAGRMTDMLKLVRGRGSNNWALGDEEIAEKLKKMGLPKGVIWPAKVISPAQVKKAMWEVTRAGVKENRTLSERQLKVIENELIKKSEGKLTVVPLSDPRPSVTVNAAPMFQAIEAPAALPSWLS